MHHDSRGRCKNKNAESAPTREEASPSALRPAQPENGEQ
jgi:hypothetical protein